MTFDATPLVGAYVITLQRHEDERGYFVRTYCQREFAECGLNTNWGSDQRQPES